MSRPGDGLQAIGLDLLTTLFANAVSALLKPSERAVYFSQRPRMQVRCRYREVLVNAPHRKLGLVWGPHIHGQGRGFSFG